MTCPPLGLARWRGGEVWGDREREREGVGGGGGG
eukprot:COSAG03_NODE_8783_length_772_cov_0.677563_1_plen_33_part_10